MNDQPETGITPGGTSGAFRDVLSKDHARRGKPPLHFADMSEEERIGKAKELGLPKFRVKQLAKSLLWPFRCQCGRIFRFSGGKTLRRG